MMKIPFIVRWKNITLNLLCICCILPILVVPGCGDNYSSSDDENDLSNTGSYACRIKWPDDVPTLETTSVVSRTINCDEAGVATVAFTFYDGSGSYLTGDEWSCSLHQGTVDGIPTGTNRRLVVTGEDTSGAMLYWGEETGIMIVAGQATQGGEIEMEYVYGTAPSTPTNVTATARNEEVTISWDTVTGATSYNIYWSTSQGVTKETGTKISTSSSPYTHTGLTNGTTYYYVVTAENSYGESGESEEVSVGMIIEPAVPGWISHANMPTGGYWSATAVWNNMLYVIGGGDRFSAIEAYDPISDSWVIKNDYDVGHLVRAITVGNVIYVLGDEGEFWEYTPSTDTWVTLPDAPTPEWVSELAEVNGKIYVFGGYNLGGLDSVWECNPTSGVWTSKAPMPTGRYGSATAVIDNKIYVFGGNYGTSSNEVYDPSTDSWEIKRDLPPRLWGWDVAGPSGWRIVVVEAKDPGSTVIYDPITDTYGWGDEIPTPRDDYPMGDSINDSIFVAGGQAAPNKLESYQPAEVLETGLRKRKAGPSAAMMEAYMQKHKKMDALLQAVEK